MTKLEKRFSLEEIKELLFKHYFASVNINELFGKDNLTVEIEKDKLVATLLVAR